MALTVLSVRVFFGVPYSVGIVGAFRILDGDVPYRDFWTIYAPGHFYVLAALFLAFGKHLVVASAARAVCVAAIGSEIFLIARTLDTTRRVAAVIAGLFVLTMWAGPPSGLTTYEPSLLFILMAWLVLARRGSVPDARAALAVGGAVGVAAWFKHDIAIYTGLAIVIGRLVEHACAVGQARWRETVRDVTFITAGAAVMVLPVVAWCWLVAGRDAWQDLIVFATTDFPKLGGGRYPGLLPDLSLMTGTVETVDTVTTWVRFTAPLVLCLGWAAVLVRGWLRRTPPSMPLIGSLILTFVAFWSAAHVRVSTHIFTISAIGLLLGGAAWTRRRMFSLGPVRTATVLLAAAYAVSLLVEPAKAVLRIAGDWPGSRSASIPSLRGLIVPARDLEFYEPIAHVVERSIPQNERIFVGMARHDVIIQSNPLIYAVVGRRGPSRFDELHAGVADRADVQHEIIDAIDRHNVRLFVLWEFGRSARVFDTLKERRSRDLPNSGASALDEFLETETRPIGQYGEYHLRWRDRVKHE